MNVLIPLNKIDGLTVGKVYELSGYTTNSGVTQLINNDRNEAFGADLGDKNFRFIFNYSKRSELPNIYTVLDEIGFENMVIEMKKLHHIDDDVNLSQAVYKIISAFYDKVLDVDEF